MTATTVGSAVARREREDKLVGWLRGQQDELAMAAASHLKPSTIVRVAQGALRANDKLMAAAVASPQSLIHCLLDAARLGHEPGTDQYYLVPYGSEVTGIEGYKGIIERMFRAGGVTSVVAQVVRQNDRYAGRGENTPPLHEYDEFASDESRGALRGVYAYATFPGGGCSQVIRMGRAEVMAHKAKSRGSSKDDSPWQQWEAAMWKKTALRALEPYVPTSTEWLDARARATATAQAIPAPAWPPPAEPARVIPSEVVPALGQAPAQDAQPAQSRAPRQRRQPVPAEVVPPEEAPWPGDAVPARPRNADRETGEVIPDGDADPTTSGASSSARAPERSSRTRTGGQSPSTSSGSETTAQEDDPRADVLAAFDALKVAGPEIPGYLTRLSGHPYTGVDALSRKAAQWFTVTLGRIGSRDELEAAAVAAEERRAQDHAAEAGDSEATGE